MSRHVPETMGQFRPDPFPLERASIVFGFWTPGPYEIIIILVIALLIFGRRLPEVGRSLGKGIVEFKKGIKGIEDEVENTSSRPTTFPMHEPVDDTYRPVEKTEPPTEEKEGGDHPS